MDTETYTKRLAETGDRAIKIQIRASIPQACAEITSDHVRITCIPSIISDIDIEIVIRRAAENLGVCYGDGELRIIRHADLPETATFAGMLDDPCKEAILEI